MQIVSDKARFPIESHTQTKSRVFSPPPFAGLQHSHKWLFPLLFALQANTLFARATEAFDARPRFAEIPIEKTVTVNQQSAGAASHQSRTISAAGRPRCNFPQIGITAHIFAQRPAGVIVHTIA